MVVRVIVLDFYGSYPERQVDLLLTDTEIEIAEKALAFTKNNRTRICRRLTDTNMFPPEESPVSVFMSGSPGAGKTETSKELVSSLAQDQGGVLRLDPDDLRTEFEEYHGSNSYLFQKAISVLIEHGPGAFSRALAASQARCKAQLYLPLPAIALLCLTAFSDGGFL